MLCEKLPAPVAEVAEVVGGAHTTPIQAIWASCGRRVTQLNVKLL